LIFLINKIIKVRKHEKQIDQLIYNLYGLTPEEIKIVENDYLDNKPRKEIKDF